MPTGDVLTRPSVEAFYKDAYISARTEAFESDQLDPIKQNTGAYTPKMLHALKDMAERDIYPDGRFGDEECNIWSLFR